MKRFLVLAVATLFTIACGDAATAPDFSGTYVLRRVNGALVPTMIPGGINGVTANATGGLLMLNADKTVTAELNVQVFVGGTYIPSTSTLTGTYTVHRDTVFVRDASDGEVTPGVITGNLFVAVMDNVTFTFERK